MQFDTFGPSHARLGDCRARVWIMNLLGIFVAIVLIALGLVVAQKVPPPFNWIIYAVLTLIVCFGLLEVFGVNLSGTTVGRPLR